ncbi:MAG: hypothetical protein ACJATT_005702 [Myxococcota bacterium]
MAAKGRRGLGHVLAPVRPAVVIVDSLGNAVCAESLAKHKFKSRQVTFECKPTRQQQSRVVVQKGMHPRTSLLARVGQPRASHHVRLPEVVGEGRFESVEVLG